MSGALFGRVVNHQQWQGVKGAYVHLLGLADGDTDQLFYRHNGDKVYQYSVLMAACYRRAPLDLVQLMIAKANFDPRKRCLLALVDNHRNTALHIALRYTDTVVVELLIREHPLALSATNRQRRTPLQCATNRPAEITSLLGEGGDEWVRVQFAAIAGGEHGAAVDDCVYAESEDAVGDGEGDAGRDHGPEASLVRKQASGLQRASMEGTEESF